MLLTGNNLGERQRELNTKVKEAATNNADFEQIKLTPENSDVDKLFKIDLASKYKNIEYIIDVLKSGDSLYISRALRCAWMYDDEFANIINVDYLHTNVIPFMSIKMKKKLLTAISIHVRKADRAAAFYKYCVDKRLNNIAIKFINFTNDDFKLQVLRDESNSGQILSSLAGENLINFIGSSFTLADAYVTIFSGSSRHYAIRSLSYLFSLSEVKYLDLIEKYTEVGPYNSNACLGIRISKSIIKRHKDRVLNNPALYIPLLNSKIVLRKSNVDDIKAYLAALLPNEIADFWDSNYCTKYNFLIDKIPTEKFEYLKSIFTAKYPSEEFETTMNFYQQRVYEFMTAEEKNNWALKHIESEHEMHGIGNNYIWYKFVNFEKAFEEIKRLIMITPDISKRAAMLDILIEAANNQRDIEKLLIYYFERHINEQRHITDNFIDKLLRDFNVYEFDENCWAALNKIFYSLEVYSVTDIYFCKPEYKIISLIYNVINNKEVHEAIKLYIRSQIVFYTLKQNTDMLPSDKKKEMVFQYLFEFYMNEIRQLKNVSYDDNVKSDLRKYIYYILDLLVQYDRTKNDCPELVMHYIKLDWEEFRYHSLIKEEVPEPTLNLIRDLKKDVNLLIGSLPLLKNNIENSYGILNISLLLRKLKVYFWHDIAQKYLNFFKGLLETDNLWRKTAQSAVHGIFQLDEDNHKVDFMKKYAPTEPKITRTDTNEKLLRIQEAICAHVSYSRPPLPLDSVLMYIKGDYVHFCLPMFQSYLVNLPLPRCIEFVEAILNTPISIQKHGMRLAFQCFNAETLNKLVLHAWNKSKNVSLRLVMFKAVLNKVTEDHEAQPVLFEALKTITLTLHEDDDNEVFQLITTNSLPRHLLRDYLEIAWKVVSQLSNKPANLNRKRGVIDKICSQILLDNVNTKVVEEIINAFIETTFSAEGIKQNKDLSHEAKSLIKSKWDLTTTYIINVRFDEELAKIELARKILVQYQTPSETEANVNAHISRELVMSFVRDLERKSYEIDAKKFESVNVVIRFVFKTLRERVPIDLMYMEVWELKMGIIARTVITDAKTNYEDKEISSDVIKQIALNFAKSIGNTVKELVKNNLYFLSFSQAIGNVISDTINNVKNCLNLHRNTIKNLHVAVGLELLKFEMFEIYLCVLQVIPKTVSSEDEEDFKIIINTLRQLDDVEIKCNLFRKFGNNIGANSSVDYPKAPNTWDASLLSTNLDVIRARRRRGAYRPRQ